MRIAIQAVISGVEGREPRTEDVGLLEYDAEAAPASGLGLFVGDAHRLLQQLQAVVLREQAARFMERAARCGRCGSRLAVKDSKTIVYRTAYGTARLRSPRLYSSCRRCGTGAAPARSFSPLAQALPERTHPQWLWLQSRYAAVMSYQQARTFLRDAFPAGRSLPVSSIKVNVLHVGQRLESEVLGVARTFMRRSGRARAMPEPHTEEPRIELAIDAGYIRALPQKEGVRNLAVVTSKLVRPVARRGYTHAYIGNCSPHQGARQQAFLTMLHVPRNVPVTVLSDGGDDVAFACKLPRPTERVLNWFHIAMRFEHLRAGVQGLQMECQYEFMKRWLLRRVEGGKWLLWQGQRQAFLQRLEELRRHTGWAGYRNPLGSLIRYLRSHTDWLIDYGKRYRQHRPISSGGAESAVEYVVDQRMKHKGHMRWSRQGANALLQVRCAVLNGVDMLNFMRWYPRDRKWAFLFAPKATEGPCPQF